MDSGFRVSRALDSFRTSLEELADAAVRERVANDEFASFKERLRALWLYARQASSVDAVVLYLMSLIGGSPRGQQWRRNNIGQKVLDHLDSEVRQVSLEIARASEVDWDAGLWLAAARMYLLYLCQSHTFGNVGATGRGAGSGPIEIEGGRSGS
ncbi:MAG: hypothetical protein JW759_02170 [Candidatus Coatesbacteria bacterium]|nr:hypothetical protein [Candidatus Coatesbacteria bacterium]